MSPLAVMRITVDAEKSQMRIHHQFCYQTPVLDSGLHPRYGVVCPIYSEAGASMVRFKDSSVTL